MHRSSRVSWLTPVWMVFPQSWSIARNTAIHR
jgi:hypothetical protein